MRHLLPSGTSCELALPSPESDTSGRGIVIAPDIFGLRPLFDRLCVQLASRFRGPVCAVEPFPGLELPTLEDRFARMSRIDDADYLGDLEAAAALVAGHGPARIGIIGFCMGGMYALKAAGLGCFDRVVSFYGMIRVPEQWRGPGQGEPLDALARPDAAKVLALLGGKDHWTPPSDIEALEATGATVVRYPDADHAFVHDPSRPTYRGEDAADAWRRVEAFLD